MYFSDHNPPHFHAFYGDDEAVFSIEPLEVIKGALKPRIEGLVIEWAKMHTKELLKNWELLKDEKRFNKIKPLV